MVVVILEHLAKSILVVRRMYTTVLLASNGG